MKKVLLGTTALATAALIAGSATDAAAAERIKLQAGGFAQHWSVALQQNVKGANKSGINPATGSAFNFEPAGLHINPVDQKVNSEVCFVGSTKLDNGITVGVNIEIEAQNRQVRVGNTTVTRHIDENFLFLESPKLGQIKLGMEDNVAELLHLSNPNGGISADDGDVVNVAMYLPTSGLFMAPGGLGVNIVNSTSVGDVFGDSESITYITPRYYGFQVGITYAPQAQDSDETLEPAYGTFGCTGGCPKYHDGIVIGSNFQHKFTAGTLNGLGVGLSAGFLNARYLANISPQQRSGDLTAVGFGSRLTYGGFTVGGGYKVITSGYINQAPIAGAPNAATRFISAKGFTYGAGGSYETGPYKVGVDCVAGRQEGDIRPGTGSATHLNCAFSGTYTLGPGIRLIGGLFMFNDTAESLANNTGAGFTTNYALGQGALATTYGTTGYGGAIGVTASF